MKDSLLPLLRTRNAAFLPLSKARGILRRSSVSISHPKKTRKSYAQAQILLDQRNLATFIQIFNWLIQST